MCSSASPTGGRIENVSIAGPRSRSGFISARPSASLPRNAASTTTNDWPRRKSGRSGIGGNWSMRPTDVTSSGTLGSHSRHACSTSLERSYGKKRTPA